jgi:nucleoside-diphosphate-sugar epimerase
MTRFVATQLATSQWYDPEPARRDLGFEPPVRPQDALARTIAWWKTRLP